MMLGQHLLGAWSSTQGVVALSSAEAEYYAMLKAASLGSGMQAMCDDIGIHMRLVIHTDSSAAKGISARRGLGKVRHMAVAYLWLQEKLSKKELEVRKVAGSENPADLMTKYLTEAVMEAHRERLECVYEDGWLPIMPRVNRSCPGGGEMGEGGNEAEERSKGARKGDEGKERR